MRKLYSFLFLLFFVVFSQAQVVISQVYGGGGNSGAPFTNDFIELFNRGTVAQDLTGWSVQYTSATGPTAPNTTWSVTPLTNVILQPGKYYLIQQAAGSTPSSALPTPDATGTLAMSGTNGKVILVNTTTAQTGANPTGSQIIDLVGYGSANAFEGTAAVGVLSNTTAAIRQNGGCTDNNQNSTDFSVGAPNPRNSATAANICSTSPTLSIASPANNTIYAPTTTSVNVALSVSNFVVGNPGTGIDGHIHYTVTYNGGTPAMTMKYDTAPISLTSLSPGTYSVFVELVNNSHAPISPAVNATINFTIAAYTTVANLAALRADVTANGTGKYYQISSNPVVTYKRTSRNQKYIQDASGAIIIDDPSTAPGVLTTNMNVGDAIAGLKGQSLLFNGLLEILPTENATVASSGNTVTPQVVTIADVLANPAAYESELLRINGVTFSNAVATFGATTANYDITGPTAATFRTIFTEADYIAQPVPTVASDILCYAGKNTVSVTTAPNVYFVSRTLADLTLANDSFSQIDGLKLYPNPVKGGTLYVETALNSNIQVSIYDIVGKQVINTPVTNNTVNVSELTSGVYIVTVTEEGKTTSKKLVITN